MEGLLCEFAPALCCSAQHGSFSEIKRHRSEWSSKACTISSHAGQNQSWTADTCGFLMESLLAKHGLK